MTLRHIEQLTRIHFDLLVCDEAHRLKNYKGKLRECLHSLKADRRLLLTGTPIQNDIDEFFSLLHFVRPEIFDDRMAFRELCENTTMMEIRNERIADVILRRTGEVLSSCLPPKHDYIIFCRPSPRQCIIYDRCTDLLPPDLLQIDILKKLCSHPYLLYQSALAKQKNRKSELSEKVLRLFDNEYKRSPPGIIESGKLFVLTWLLGHIRCKGESAVIASSYTKTLDMIEAVCVGLRLTVYRLDGTISTRDRLHIIDEFNKCPHPNKVFLLSTKAGGVGVNLTGASHFILYDSHWNPANDIQAMARIWRDGQVKECHILRLVTTGTIEEKILQRQIMKTGLGAVISSDCDSVVDFTEDNDEIRDIFSRNEITQCETHDRLGCECGGTGVMSFQNDIGEDSISITNSAEKMECSPVSAITDDATNGHDHSSNDALHNEAENDSAEDKPTKAFLTECDIDKMREKASLAELYKWKHFSSHNSDFCQSMKKEICSKNICGYDPITFVMTFTSRYE
ncbi:hypothetical protein AB6A40_002656 [Gnathostoma spinigerum]|uniref:DNA repair and recombination protein RAD54-like n=1 Tax=Gnathostoma spinigerum TaxID=75299 RepID=A0ABD6EGZ0_9BILA